MQENEFEASVNHQMEDFGIEPSAQVWTAVERRIRKEKKRRFAIWFWFLLPLLAAGIFTAVLLNQQDNNSTVASTTFVEKNSKETNFSPDIKNNPSPVNDRREHIESSEKNSRKAENMGDKKNAATETKGKAEKKNNLPGIFGNQRNLKRNSMLPVMEDKVENASANNTQTPGLKNDLLIKHMEPVKEVSSTSTNNSITLADTIDIASNDKKANSKNLKITDSLEHTSTLRDSLTSTAEKKTATIKIRKWTRGVQIAVGRSGFSNGIFNLNQSLSADPLFNSGQGSGPNTSAGPSPVNASFYWSAGVFIQKSINKKLDISIGLDYSFLSTKNTIGSKVDSSRLVSNNRSNPIQVDQFYRPAGAGDSRSYSNQFHFVGLSADIAWKIIIAKRFRMYWENGIAYNRLVGSNMLQYSSELPGYYRDNDLLNKNQLIFKTGLLFPLSQNLSLKPFIHYQLIPVFKNYQGTNTHFSMVGLQLKYFIKN